MRPYNIGPFGPCEVYTYIFFVYIYIYIYILNTRVRLRAHLVSFLAQESSWGLVGVLAFPLRVHRFALIFLGLYFSTCLRHVWFVLGWSWGCLELGCFGCLMFVGGVMGHIYFELDGWLAGWLVRWPAG
jgi:hypothetical protein